MCVNSQHQEGKGGEVSPILGTHWIVTWLGEAAPPLKGTPSIVAVFTSCNILYAQYPAFMEIQESRCVAGEFLDDRVDEFTPRGCTLANSVRRM